MMTRIGSLIFGLAIAGVAFAMPSPVERDTTVSLVPAATESTLTIYAEFSRAAYCNVTTTWTCGGMHSTLSINT